MSAPAAGAAPGGSACRVTDTVWRRYRAGRFLLPGVRCAQCWRGAQAEQEPEPMALAIART